MFKHLTPFIALLCVAGSLSMSTLSAGGKKGKQSPQAKKALSRVDEYLKKQTKTPFQPVKMVIVDMNLHHLFPKHTFVAVRFRQFPVAVAPPKGLKSSNVFVVPHMGKVQAITTPDQMNKFFSSQIGKAGAKINEKTAEKAVRAYLMVAQQLFQDGFYKFEIVQAKATKTDNGISANGRAVVMKGGNGELKVSMGFQGGELLAVSSSQALLRGPRPRCQATKLLDADPIVRYMAETELLFMGKAANGYLREQRAKANPRLRKAIDRILQKIEDSGW